MPWRADGANNRGCALLSAEVDFGRDALPDLHTVLAGLRERERVASVRYDGGPAHLILRHAELSAAFRDEETFPAADAYRRFAEPAQGRTMQCMPAAEHRRHRDLVSPAFAPASVEKLARRIIEPAAIELVERIASRGEVDLVSEFARPFSTAVITRWLGLPSSDDALLRRCADGLLSYRVDPARALAARAEFTKVLTPAVAQRRERPGDDLLSLLVRAQIDGAPLTDEAIFSFVRLLFPAGADTTFLGIGSLMHAVLTHGEVRERLQSDRAAHKLAVEESLRLEPPVALQPRTAPRGAHLGGVDIPAGAWVLFGIASANRDAAVFEAPDRFDLDRAPRDSLAFGAGTHFCLGSHLARAEMEVALHVLLERLPGLCLASDAPIVTRGAIFRGPRHLPVRF